MALNYDKEKLYDVIVIGGGPAGLTAALYLSRARYRVLVLEKEAFGGQITITSEVVNYPGITRASGKEITEAMKKQGELFGAEFLIGEAKDINPVGDVKTVKTDRGDYYCLGVLIATGAHPREVGFKGERENKGRGVAYCATCDGEFFTDKEIFVVGGGYAAAEESVFLTKFASHVTILIRSDDFTCAKAVSEPARQNEKITVLTNTVVEEVRGEGGLNYIRYKNLKTDTVTEYRAKENDFFGVFVLAGYTPDTKIVRGLLELDEYGYIVTDKEQKTSVDGIYAAGDVCIKPLRQVVTATADGALAATELEKYVAAMQKKTGIFPLLPVKKETVKKASKVSESQAQEGLFTPEIKEQLSALFSRMKEKAILKLYLDYRDISKELLAYARELVSLTEWLELEIADTNASPDLAPYVKICKYNGKETGLAFHGVPGGHEFSPFVLGIYNAIGPGQEIGEKTLERIKKIKEPLDIKVLISLSCSMCPDTVIAAQQIAAKNESVTAEIYDVHHFEALRKKYNVMSVPCVVLNDENLSFGKKNIEGLLDLIK